MQKKNLLKAICVALVAISFSCAESATEKTGPDTTAPTTIDTNISRSAAPIDTTKKDSGDRNQRPLPPPPPPASTTTN
jgi:hypothetical protein